MRKQCEHLHTPWSSSHSGHHLGERQQRGQSHRAREALALEADFTIDKLESLHASVRRRIKTRERGGEIQTHAINAAWVIDTPQCRERTHRWMDEVSQLLGACDADGADSSVDDVRGGRGRGGGLWCAYVRDQTFGRKGQPNLHELSIEYKRMSAADRERLAPLGVAATRTYAADRPGCPSAFGPRRREVSRALQRRSHEMYVRQLEDDPAVIPARQQVGGGVQPRVAEWVRHTQSASPPSYFATQRVSELVQRWQQEKGEKRLIDLILSQPHDSAAAETWHATLGLPPTDR